MKKPLSIGIVTGSLSRKAGGLFNSVRKSAIHLAEAGAAVSVYGLADEHTAADLPEWAPLRPHALGTRNYGPLAHAPELSGMLTRANHDVLHLHGIWQLQSLAVKGWRRKTGRAVMISPRGMLDPWALGNSGWKKRIVGAWFENRNLREADCLHALNASEAASMRTYGLANPIAIIPNATDLPDIAPRLAKEGKKTLLFLGRIHPKKGLSELIAAWAMAGAAVQGEWSLAIAGWDDGGHLDGLRAQIDELGVSETVSILGPAYGAEKDRLLREADGFILPSFSGGLPMSVLEAWAYRLPVLMTRECNLPEGFVRGAAVEIATDPEILSHRLTGALTDPGFAALGEAGRALVEERFSWAHAAAEHLAVYQWLLAGGEAPACVQGA